MCRFRIGWERCIAADQYIDVVFSSGNGIVRVDDQLVRARSTGRGARHARVVLCPAEELLWSSAFVQERERYDGAAVLHLLHAQALFFDWPRLLERFGDNWAVLLSYVVLFRFAYPDRRGDVPDEVINELLGRFSRQQPEPDNPLCAGHAALPPAVSVRHRAAWLH